MYLINQNAFRNVNSPGSGTMNWIGLLVGPLAWYVISALLAMLRANPKKIKFSHGIMTTDIRNNVLYSQRDILTRGGHTHAICDQHAKLWQLR